MKISKVFLKDMLTKRKIKQYAVLYIAFFILMKLFLKEMIGSIFNDQSLPLLTVIIIFTSTAYTIYTYSLFEKIKQYIMLPVKDYKFLIGFSMSLFICALLERISFLFIGIILCNDNPLLAIVTVLIYSSLSILLNVWMMILLNNNYKIEWIGTVIVIIILISNIFIDLKTKLSLAGIVLCFIIIIVSILNHKGLDLAINRKRKKSRTKFNTLKNYFLRVLLTEKIYIINTLMTVIMIVFLAVINDDNPVILTLIWTLGAINTPVLTMLSGDPYLRKQAELLPNKGITIWSMYRSFLLSYFVIINSIIFISIEITTSQKTILNIILLILLSILEILIGYILEKNLYLKNYQTKQELWKHPRKYILPIIIFLISSLIFILAD